MWNVDTVKCGMVNVECGLCGLLYREHKTALGFRLYFGCVRLPMRAMASIWLCRPGTDGRSNGIGIKILHADFVARVL